MKKNPIKANIVAKKRLLIIDRVNWSVERLFEEKQFKEKNIHRFDEFLLAGGWGGGGGNADATEWFLTASGLSSRCVEWFPGSRNRCYGRKDSNGEFMSLSLSVHSLSFQQSKQPI